MNNHRWVIALDKRTGKRMEFTMCDLNNVAFYQSKYTLDGYDVKVLTARKWSFLNAVCVAVEVSGLMMNGTSMLKVVSGL